tara:strand:- start:2 stop:409 length:408 start_codon:yes stop_codon:yes gene_type:complete
MSKRISKMLFSKERVELGLQQDAKQAVNKFLDYSEITDKADDEIKQLQSQVDNLRNKYISIDSKQIQNKKNLVASENEMKSIMQKYESSAKELGVNPNDIKEYSNLDFNIKVAKNFISNAEEISKTARKYIKGLN